jgi:hypothetical protein
MWILKEKMLADGRYAGHSAVMKVPTELSVTAYPEIL